MSESNGSNREHERLGLMRSDTIRSEYLASGCQRSDAEDAVRRLMDDCGDLFDCEDHAWGFLMEVDGHVERRLMPQGG